MKTAGAGLLLLALAACGNDPKEVSKENFARVLEAEVAGRVPCVYTSRTFPAEMSYLEPGTVRLGPEREYEALREVGLVRLGPEGADTSKAARVFQSIRVELTDAGRAAYRDDAAGFMPGPRPRFCGGRKALVDVVRYTEPADMLGVRYSGVTYRYQILDLPPWVAKLENVFPQQVRPLLDASREPAEGKAGVVLTSEGWIPENQATGL